MIARLAVAGAVVGLVGVTSCLAGAQAVSFDPAVSHELAQPYYSGAIVPTPRQVEYRDEYVLLIDGPKAVKHCAVQVEYGGAAQGLAARLLAERLEKYEARYPDGATSTTAVEMIIPVVVALADEPWLTRYVLAERAQALQPQGYLLEVRPDAIVCLGKDNAGVVNAVASLLQLMHVRDGRLVVRCASVRDWPTFVVRYTAEYHLPGPDFFDWMMRYKINGFGACYPGMRWEGLTDAKREGLKAIGAYIRQYQTMHFLVEFHVGGRAGRPVDCGNPDDVATLLDTIRETMTLTPTQHVMICYDDVKPELQLEELGQFESPAHAHGHLMQRVYEAVKAKSGDTMVSFCTPFYQGRQHRRWRSDNLRSKGLAYLATVGAWENEDIVVVWTGPVTESRHISLEDISSYRDWLGSDRPLFYWDNTWHYHQPMRNFHAQYPEAFVDHCAGRSSYINVNGVKPIGRFFAATANDYYWNPGAFDPKRARRHAVAQFMGPQAVPATEAFYDLRGDDYFVFFARDVDLEAFDKAVAAIEKTSLDPELAAHCRAVYEGVAKKRRAQ